MEAELKKPGSALVPCTFPGVGWFVHAIKAGSVTVGTGGRFEKTMHQNRYLIPAANGVQKLTVPVEHTGSKKRIAEAQISYAEPWVKNHITALNSAYRNAPFFEFYDYRLFPLLESKPLKLIDFITSSVRFLHQYLCPETPLNFTDESFDYRDFDNTEPYPQVFDDRFGFQPGMSALDLLFNLGPEAAEYLQRAAKTPQLNSGKMEL